MRHRVVLRGVAYDLYTGHPPTKDPPTMHTLKDFDNLPFTGRHRAITLCAGGGSFIDAYVLIIIGVALENLMKDFSLDTFWVGVITASTFVGLAIGTTLFGYIADRIGRKKLFIFNIFALATCSILSALVTTPTELALARFFMGLLIGADYPIATSMVAEFSPIKSRAWAMGTIAAIWFVGGICASLAGYFCYDLENSWRWMLASAVIPCVLVLWGRIRVPESPRWLLMHGKAAKARAVFKKFGLDIPLSELEKDVHRDVESVNILGIFQGKNLRNLVFVATIWLCQAVPMFAIYMYGPQIMSGFDAVTPKEALLANTVTSIAFFLGCIPAMWCTTEFGRRVVCISSYLLMTLSLGAMVLWSTNPVVLFIGLVTYALVSGGPGTLQWLYPNELFSTDIRATAVGCAMSITRIATILTTFYMYPILLKYGCETVLMGAFLITMVGLVTSVLFAPETKNLSLMGADHV